MKKLKFLHIGCGPKRKEQTTSVFNSDDWEEVTFDIDAQCSPDILGSMTDLSMINDNTFDAVYSSHNIEHLFIHEAVIAVKEFFRVLKSSGFMMIVCPDLISTCKAIIDKGPLEPLYHLNNNNGYVSGVDILYGWRPSIEDGNHFMAHKCGFSEQSLIALFQQSGFKKIISTARSSHFDINLLAYKDDKIENEDIKSLFLRHLKI
tara:strand:+ start:888 stop:1502 length:615 start_codon:yes stop_codon:yes gene_type:complete